MKNLSKVLAVVLSFMLVFTTVGAASYTDVAADAKYGEAVSVLSSLNILKGYEDGTFKPDGDITRAEFAAVVCRLLGLEETANGAKGQQVFNDVPGDHWASGYVALASQQGIVNGYGDGNFGPEDKVLYEQAIKMVVAALGYTPMAEVNGGYPGGYQIVAAQRGILANVSGGATGVAATRAIVAQMSYNALEVPIMGQTSFGTDVSFEATENLLLNKLNVVKFEGTIEQTPASDDSIKDGKVQVKYERQVTAVKSNYTAQRYYMDKAENDANPSDVYGTSMSDSRYKKATINVADDVKAAAESYLDYNVVMYVENATDSDATLIAVYPKASKNSDLTFKSKDLYESKTSLTKGSDVVSGTIAVYTDKDADKYDKHDVEITKVYVNGRQTAPVEIGSIEENTSIKDIASAKEVLDYYLDDAKDVDIKLVCNTSGDEYNIVYITDYFDVVVETINEKTTTIVGKESNKASNLLAKVIFDEDEYAGRYSIVKDGAPATFADIKVDDVLSIAGYVNSSTRELEYGVVTITSEKASGSVTTYDEDDKTITVGGKTYDYNANIGDKITDGQTGSTSGIKLGDEITLYVNARGCVVAMDKTASNQNLKYGFATKAVKSTGVEDSWQIRVLTTDGTWATFDMASKVSFDGATSVSTTSITDDNMATKLAANVVDGKVLLNKVVAYETNSSNEVKTIYVTAKKDDVDAAFNYSAISGNDYVEATESLGSVFLSDTTAIFSYPTSADLDKAIDEDDISVAKKDSLVNRNEYTAKAYGLDDDYYAKIICGAGLVGEIALNNDFFVISAKSNTTNEDGDEGYNLTGYVAGEEITLFADKSDVEVINAEFESGKIVVTGDDITTTTVASLEKGDVVLYSKAANGEADKIIRLVKAADLLNSKNAGGLEYSMDSLKLAEFEAAGDNYCFYLGLAYDKSGNTLKLADNAEGTDAINVSAKSSVTGASVDLFASKIKVKDATAGDIDTDSTGDGKADVVFVRTQNDTIVEDIVIFEYDN